MVLVHNLLLCSKNPFLRFIISFPQLSATLNSIPLKYDTATLLLVFGFVVISTFCQNLSFLELGIMDFKTQHKKPKPVLNGACLHLDPHRIIFA
jgi:hypothetical protein